MNTSISFIASDFRSFLNLSFRGGERNHYPTADSKQPRNPQNELFGTTKFCKSSLFFSLIPSPFLIDGFLLRPFPFCHPERVRKSLPKQTPMPARDPYNAVFRITMFCNSFFRSISV